MSGLGLSNEQVTAAWVYLLGRYLVIRQEAIDLDEAGIDYNVIKHNPPVVVGSGAEAAPTFVNPNLDVVYSEAWIAVDETTPAILTIPAIPAGRYYTAQIVDEWAEITHNINERNFPEHPHGRYAICLAGSSPDIPDDCLRVDIPSPKAKLLTGSSSLTTSTPPSLCSTSSPSSRPATLRRHRRPTSPPSITRTYPAAGSSPSRTSTPPWRLPTHAAAPTRSSR